MANKYILGNWKMHGTQAMSQALVKAVIAHTAPEGVQVVLFPPAPLLPVVGWALKGSRVALGAQNVSPHPDGAFTGDVSAAMLKDAGCAYVIVGHSERRQNHGESDAFIAAKAQAALHAGLIPVVCVGETQQERESRDFLAILQEQVENSLPETDAQGCIIAYEPVWAIGSGQTPTGEEIAEVHKTIASLPAYARSGAALGIVYGGSVKAANAAEILGIAGVDGVLVGGASLKADEFGAIIDAAH